MHAQGHPPCNANQMQGKRKPNANQMQTNFGEDANQVQIKCKSSANQVQTNVTPLRHSRRGGSSSLDNSKATKLSNPFRVDERWRCSLPRVALRLPWAVLSNPCGVNTVGYAVQSPAG